MGRFIGEDTREAWRGMAYASSIGMALAFAILLGLGAGWLVDHFMGWDPYGKGVGLGLGIIAGYRNVYIIMKRIEKKDKKNKD